MKRFGKTLRRMPRSLRLLGMLLAAAVCVGSITTALAAELSPCPDTVAIKYVTTAQVTGGNYPGMWTLSNGTLTGYAVSGKNTTYDGSNYYPRTGTVEIKNVTSAAIRLEFDWTSSADIGEGSVSVNGNTAPAGHFSGTLASEASITVEVTSPVVSLMSADAPPKEYIYLSNFVAASAADTSVTLRAPESGSYTVASPNGGNVTMNAGDADRSYGFTSTDGITVNAAAGEGQQFYMWEDGASGIPYSTTNSTTIYPQNGQVVHPVLSPAGAASSFLVNGERFIYWEDAMKMAAANSGAAKTVILTADLSLPTTLAGNGGRTGTYVTGTDGALSYSLPAGVTLVVPYDATNNTSPDAVVGGTGQAAYTVRNTAYRTLTVPQGTNLTVPNSATLIVNALQGAATNANESMGRVLGTYGKMVVSGTVDVYGTLYARGYIVDGGHGTANCHTGSMSAHPGANVYQLMQIRDWRGGTVTFGMYQYLMAINMYYFENIMVDMNYAGGANLIAQACIAASGTTFTANVPVVSDGTNGRTSIFIMNASCAISTSYDYENDQLNIIITEGCVSMQCLEISMDMGTDQGLRINSANYPLAVSDNMQITVKSGATMETQYDLKFLPGAGIKVEAGGTMTVGENSHLYFYSADTYEAGWAKNVFRTRLDCDLVKDPGTKVTPTADAKLDVYGTLNLNGVLMQSQDGQSGITPHAGAVIHVNKTPQTEAELYECYNGGAYNAAEAQKWTLKPTGDGSSLYYTVVDNWCAIKGRMAESAADGGCYTPFVESGTYQAVNIAGSYYWYKYAVTYQYASASGAGTVPANETTYVSLSTANHPVAGAGAVRYAATAAATVSPDVTIAPGSASVNNLIADGVEDVALSGLTADTTVALTVKPYTYRVLWQEYQDGAGTVSREMADYTTAATVERTWSETATVGSLTLDNDAITAGTTVSASGNKITVSAIAGDTTVAVNVGYSSYPVNVYVRIPGAGITYGAYPVGIDMNLAGNTYEAKFGADYVYNLLSAVSKNGSSTSMPLTNYVTNFNLQATALAGSQGMTVTGLQTTGYYIADQIEVAGTADVSITGNGANLTLSHVGSAVSIYVTMKHCDYKVDYVINGYDQTAQTKDTSGCLKYKLGTAAGTNEYRTDVKAVPAYVNAGDVVTLRSDDVQKSGNYDFKFMFTGAGTSGVTVTENKAVFDSTGITSDTKVNLSMTYYDFTMQLKNTAGYTLKTIYVQNYKDDGAMLNGNAVYRYTAVGGWTPNAAMPYAEAKRVNAEGAQDTAGAYMAYTYTFADGVYLDKVGASVLPYAVTKQSFNRDGETDVVDQAVVAVDNATDSTPAAITVTSKSYAYTTYQGGTQNHDEMMTAGTVTVNPVSYNYVVTFTNGVNVLGTQYIADSTATYTCADRTAVAAVQAAAGLQVNNNGTSVTVSGITANTTVVLDLADYTYKTTWNVTKGEDVYTATEFLSGTGGWHVVATVGTLPAELAALSVTGSGSAGQETLSAAGHHVIANGASISSGSESIPAVTLADKSYTVALSMDSTVNLELVPYDYVITFTDGTDTLKTQYVNGATGMDVMRTSKVFYLPFGAVITGYELSGGTANVTGNAGDNANVADGWKGINLDTMTADATVALTLKPYDWTVRWTITYPTGAVTRVTHYAANNGADTWALRDTAYVIKTATGAVVGNSGTTATLDNITQNMVASVTLKDAKTTVFYTVDGGAEQSEELSDTTWTLPSSFLTGRTITGVVVTGDPEAQIANFVTSLTISGISSTMHVTITTAEIPAPPDPEDPQEPVKEPDPPVDVFDDYTALWGDMSFEYYKNSAHYSWDPTMNDGAGGLRFNPGNTYSWRHKTGSERYTLITGNDGSTTTYVVPHGSILLLNLSNTPVSYTVKLDKTNAVEGGWAHMQWAITGDAAGYRIQSRDTDQIIVLVQPGGMALASGTMTGTADNLTLDNANVGVVTVGTAVISQ